jgi:hypothetical protein
LTIAAPTTEELALDKGLALEDGHDHHDVISANLLAFMKS